MVFRSPSGCTFCCPPIHNFRQYLEDFSGELLLQELLPKLLGPQSQPHTWRLHSYEGIGRVPKDLAKVGDPAKRILLNQLPRLLRGYARTPGIDAVVVVLDVDRRDCRAFLDELKLIAEDASRDAITMFRLAIEEMEAWYFGDEAALIAAYPKAKREVLDRYVQDSICDTWELFADAVYPGGSGAIKKVGWPLPGQVKCDWARSLGPLLDPDQNVSPSFGKLRDGLRSLTS